MRFSAKFMVKMGGKILVAETVPSSLILSGSIGMGGAEIGYTVEGNLVVLDVKRAPLKDLFMRPRGVLEKLGGLRDLAMALMLTGYNVEVRVRGLKVASYP